MLNFSPVSFGQLMGQVQNNFPQPSPHKLPAEWRDFFVPCKLIAHLAVDTALRYCFTMKRKNSKTLALIFARPVSGSIKWRDIESLLVDLGATVSEREGSRIGVKLFDEVRVFHRSHP